MRRLRRYAISSWRSSNGDWHIVMATTFLATVPVAIVFAWLQRWLIRDLALAAVK
jgi:ABC-type glycerol-3-phosphate transport system permease component